MTNLNRIATTGKSGASIMAAGMGMSGHQSAEDKAHPVYRALRRLHKKEVLELCEDYSRRKGLRLDRRVLP